MQESCRALILSLNPAWLAIARLPGALKAAGFRTAAIGYGDSLVMQSRHVDERFELGRFRFSLTRIIAVIARWQPDLVIPGDEDALKLLRFIADELKQIKPTMPPESVARIIDASLGAAAYREAWGKRQQVQEIAAAIGLRTPPSAAIATAAEAQDFAARHGYPVVLKADDTSGGGGVAVCRDAGAVKAALHGPLRAARHKASGRAKLRRLLLRRYGYDEVEKGGLSVHAYVAGRPAMRAFVSLAGTSWAGLTAIAERTHPEPNGPSTVVRFTEHAEITAATESFVRHVGYSGFGGLDFLIAPDGEAHFIEFNSRPISISHMGGRVGIDLAWAMRRALKGEGAAGHARLERDYVIAHFPQEWYRDLASEYLASGQIDVPWDDPPLLRAFAATYPR